MANVFISRGIEKCSFIKQELDQSGHKVICESCIETQSVPFTVQLNFDWIFFSSSEGVRHFFSQKKINISSKLAAMGIGTAGELEQYGSIEFIGSTTNPAKVAEEFSKKILHNETTLFPVGKKSLRSIPKYFPSDKKTEIIVYDTLQKKISVPVQDVYVFSSPSNFLSFAQQNSISNQSAIITFGPSTSKSVREKGMTVKIELTETSERNIVNAINSVLSS